MRTSPIEVQAPATAELNHERIGGRRITHEGKHLSFEERISQAFSNLNSSVVKTISTSGRNGLNGTSGQSGQSGRNGIVGTNGRSASMPGQSGENGSNGSDGTHGSAGGNGSDGESGQDARNLIVKLSGNHRQLIVDTDDYTGQLNLHNSGILVLEAVGGDGGAGGSGGDGGRGGSGGSGGNGGNGFFGPVVGAAGNGGNAGNGGDGANGGNAGRGGDGGAGGKITVMSKDASLFHLVNARCNGGKPGKSGKPGAGGPAGAAGKAGSAGNPGQYFDGKALKVGPFGYSGKDGSSGNAGLNGQGSYDGRSRGNGSLQFTLIDDNGSILETGNKLYDAKVISLRVLEAVYDGIFEPGERVWIDEITIVNDGDLSLPAGARLLLQPLHNYSATGLMIKPENDIYLPAIPPHTTYKCTQIIEATISNVGNSVVESTPRFKENVSFRLQVELLDRVFPNSMLKGEIPVTFPILVRDAISPAQMSTSDLGELQVVIENHSDIDYGVELGKSNSQVFCEVELTGDLHFVNYQTKVIRYPVPIIKAQDRYTIIEPILMGIEAHFFEKVTWNARVFIMRDGDMKLAHKKSQYVKTVPYFNRFTADTDVLCFTNLHFTEEEFKSYCAMFKALNLRANYWDLDLYKGISQNAETQKEHEISWKNQYRNKLIVLPLYHKPTEKETFQQMSADDLASHFVSLKEENPSSFDSGLLMIGNLHSLNSQYMRQHLSKVSELPSKEVLPADFAGRFVISSPTVRDMEEKRNQLIDNYEEADPKLRYWVHASFDPYKIGFGKYCYGKAFSYNLPLNLNHRFYCAKASSPSYYPPHTSVPMNDNFFKIFYGMIKSLPLKHRVLQLKTVDSNVDWKFIPSEPFFKRLNLFCKTKDLISKTIIVDILSEHSLGESFTTIQTISNWISESPEEHLSNDLVHTLFTAFLKLMSRTTYAGALPGFLSPAASKLQQKQLKVQEEQKKFEGQLNLAVDKIQNDEVLTMDVQVLKYKAELDLQNRVIDEMFDYEDWRIVHALE